MTLKIQIFIGSGPTLWASDFTEVRTLADIEKVIYRTHRERLLHSGESWLEPYEAKIRARAANKALGISTMFTVSSYKYQHPLGICYALAERASYRLKSLGYL